MSAPDKSRSGRSRLFRRIIAARAFRPFWGGSDDWFAALLHSDRLTAVDPETLARIL